MSVGFKSSANVSDETELASGFTVRDYKAALDAQAKKTIAEALRRRFTERYISPVMPGPGKQMHGFTMMAISCLMIEALESFRHGWPDTSALAILPPPMKATEGKLSM